MNGARFTASGRGRPREASGPPKVEWVPMKTPNAITLLVLIVGTAIAAEVLIDGWPLAVTIGVAVVAPITWLMAAGAAEMARLEEAAEADLRQELGRAPTELEVKLRVKSTQMLSRDPSLVERATAAAISELTNELGREPNEAETRQRLHRVAERERDLANREWERELADRVRKESQSQQSTAGQTIFASEEVRRAWNAAGRGKRGAKRRRSRKRTSSSDPSAFASEKVRRAWLAADRKDQADEAWERRRRTYGVSQARFRRLLADQSWGCGMCGTRNPPVPAGRVDGWHVDHDHQTGRVRGILCSRCNVRLGALGDQLPAVKQAMLTATGDRLTTAKQAHYYLERHEQRVVAHADLKR